MSSPQCRESGTGTRLPKFAAALLSRENIGNGRRAHPGLILNTLIDAEIDGTPNRFPVPLLDDNVLIAKSVATKQPGVSLQRVNAGERLVRIPISPGRLQGFAIPCQDLRIVVPDILCASNGVERARRISGVNTESAI
jgi:hypothetical protein